MEYATEVRRILSTDFADGIVVRGVEGMSHVVVISGSKGLALDIAGTFFNSAFDVAIPAAFDHAARYWYTRLCPRV